VFLLLRQQAVCSMAQVFFGKFGFCGGIGEGTECQFLLGGLEQAASLAAVAEVFALSVLQLTEEVCADISCSFGEGKLLLFGEAPEDLQDFDPEYYAEALFSAEKA
jgi:hypothetical protein